MYETQSLRHPVNSNQNVNVTLNANTNANLNFLSNADIQSRNGVTLLAIVASSAFRFSGFLSGCDPLSPPPPHPHLQLEIIETNW